MVGVWVPPQVVGYFFPLECKHQANIALSIFASIMAFLKSKFLAYLMIT